MEETVESWEARPEEERRAIQEQRLRDLSYETQNPMYAWLALSARLTAAIDYEHPDGPIIAQDVTIPGWVADYLSGVADNLGFLASGIDPRVNLAKSDLGGFASFEEAMATHDMHMTIKPRIIEPDAAMKLVPTIMGLTGAGRNAFAALQSTVKRMGEFRLYESVREEGGSAKDALAKVCEVYGLKSDRQALRRVQEGRALANWQVSKPTP